MELTTARLVMVPATIELIQAVIDRQHALAGGLAQLTIPPTWPGNRDALDGLPSHLEAMRADPRELLWRIRLSVLRSDRVAIGSISLKGPPCDGSVEIGWGVLPSVRRHGFGLESSAAVVDWVKAQPSVRRIIATIDDTNAASIRIAERLGMHRTAETHRDLPVYELTGW